MSKNIVTRAHSISQAATGTFCPYCGKQPAKIINHIKNCPKVAENREAAKAYVEEQYQYALHDVCGDVMILNINNGLALIENKYGRYVVPVSSLQCGGTADVMKAIDKAKLSEEQSKSIIAYLANQFGIVEIDKNVMPNVQKLIEGSKVEVIINGKIKTGTIKTRYSDQQYSISIDNGPTVNIHKKNIKTLET